MTTTRSLLLAATLLIGAGLPAPAHAQATRTWVSGVGDDVNPCSRTAPCKTFAGAISKTAPGGEINCLDPAGFGAVTITKSMTISCPYTEGGALAGGNGIVVNAGATDVVYLRGLDIFGVSPPANGVRFVAGGALHIESSVIRRFNATNSFGVSFQPSGVADLYITDTTIGDNGNATSGGGILIQPTGSGAARVVLRRVRLHNNPNHGLRVDSAGGTASVVNFVTVEDSAVAGSTVGIFINGPAGPPQVSAMIVNSSVLDNRNIGISAAGTRATARVGHSTITGNATGILISGGAVMSSYGNNRLDGNGTDGTFTAPVIPTK